METVKTSVLPDVHHVIQVQHRAWDLITDSGTELKISGIPCLSIHFDRTRIIPRTFSVALAGRELMSLTEISFAHDLVPPTLRKWSAAINTCNRWLDGYSDNKCSVLRDIARDGCFGYTGQFDSKIIIDEHAREFLSYAENSTCKHLDHVVSESTNLLSIVKQVFLGLSMNSPPMHYTNVL